LERILKIEGVIRKAATAGGSNPCWYLLVQKALEKF